MNPFDPKSAKEEEEVSPQRAAERRRNAMAVAYHDQAEADRQLVEEDWVVSVETWPEYEEAEPERG